MFSSRNGPAHRRLAVVLLLLAIACLPVANALRLETGAYSFRNVADTTRERFEQIFPSPALDNAGTLVFAARLINGDECIFAARHGWNFSLVTLVHTRGSFGYLGNLPSVNNEGTVVFSAGYRRGGTCVATVPTKGGSISTVAVTGGPSITVHPDQSSINNSGQVAFYRRQDNGLEGVFVCDARGGPMTKVADNKGDFSTFGLAPSIDDAGSVTFRASTKHGRWGLYRVQHTGNDPVLLVATGSSGVGTRGFISVSNAVTNAKGTAVFHAERYDGAEGLYKIQTPGGALTKVVDLAGTGYEKFFGWAVNDQGRVAFGAYADGKSGIFAGPDLRKDRVVGTGDTLFGFPVHSVSVAGRCLNDAGEIAFTYRWVDQRAGVAVATPQRWSRWTTLLLVCSAGLLGGSVFMWVRSRRLD